jgi:hypothetical protein
MNQLLAVLGSEFLGKTHIINFKSAVSRPIRGFNIWGISKKIIKTQKLSKISKMSKVIS